MSSNAEKVSSPSAQVIADSLSLSTTRLFRRQRRSLTGLGTDLGGAASARASVRCIIHFIPQSHVDFPEAQPQYTSVDLPWNPGYEGFVSRFRNAHSLGRRRCRRSRMSGNAAAIGEVSR